MSAKDDRNEAEAGSLREGTGWFEPLYADAGRDAEQVPWANLRPNRFIMEWLERERPRGDGLRALVPGCGLGDDAEELARLGFEVNAFDLAPSAIAWARERFPDSPVDYRVANLFDLPREWRRSFDFVAEVYTLQSLSADIRLEAVRLMPELVAPGGRLLLICRGREPDQDLGGPPWPLTRAELRALEDAGLEELRFEDLRVRDDRDPDVGIRRFRILYSHP